MDNNLKDFYRQIQSDEIENVFYGENDVISRLGFDSIEAFDKGINDVREVIKDYDSLLMENQAKLKDVARDLDLFKSHPEMALPNQADTLNNQYVSLMGKQNKYLEKQEKEKKCLDELLEAKKEFIRETRFHYKNEAKDKVTLLNEYDVKMKEMKSLEGKISMGIANPIEQARYDALKNEIIPDLESMIGVKGKNKVDRNEDNINNKNQNLDEFVNNMTVEEMNTILNMKASGNYDDSIMNNISSRLGVDVSKLDEIASLKNSSLINSESNKNDLESDELVDSNSLDEVEKESEVVKSSSVDNNSDNTKESSTKVSADPTPEKRKVPKKLGVAGANLIAAIANNKGKAMLGLLGIAAIAALAITNPVMLWTILAGAGLGKAYKDFQAGAKGR